MSAVTGIRAVTFLDPVDLPGASVISSQINLIGRQIAKVIADLERVAELTPFQAAKIQKDGPIMLKKLELDLKNLITPFPIRDSLWYHFDDENHVIDLDEDATAAEIDRAKALLKFITNCGLDLPEKINIQTYHKLAYQAQKVWIFVRRMKGEMESFSQSFAKQAKFSSEIEYLKDAVVKLRRKVNILSRCVKIYKSDEVNFFTLDAEQRFTELASRANEVGFETLRAIVLVGVAEEGKLTAPPAVSNPLVYKTIIAIENNAFETLCSIQENGAALYES